MKLPDRERKTVNPFENEFLSVLLPMMQRPKSYKKSARKASTAATSTKKVAAPAATLTRKVSVKGPEPVLTRKESQQADALFRRGSQTHKWQFLEDSGRWANYDAEANKEVERAYANWLVSPHVDVRSVKSGTWEYMVDFNLMTQQNVKHAAHKVRRIQRVLA